MKSAPKYKYTSEILEPNKYYRKKSNVTSNWLEIKLNLPNLTVENAYLNKGC